MNAAAIQNTGIQWEPGKWLGAGKKDEGRRSSRKRGKASASPVTVLPGTPEKTPDEKLMLAISTGDKLALEELYDRYFSGCYGLALKIVSDPAAAEEIVQDVFLKLWSRPESYVPERGKFSGWLLTLVHNRSVDKLRRAKAGGRSNSVPLDLDNGSGLTVADMLPDPSPTPYEEAWSLEKGSILRSALAKLPATQREAISLAYFNGLTQKEIAERLGEPLGTIKTRTRSGLLALRRLLVRQGALGELE